MKHAKRIGLFLTLTSLNMVAYTNCGKYRPLESTKQSNSQEGANSGADAGSEPAVPVVYSAPMEITKGGTYTVNIESLDPKVPAIRILTSEPVIITKSRMRSKNHCIVGFSTRVTITDSICEGINPNVDGQAKGNFAHLEEAYNIRIENNTVRQMGGIYIRDFKGNFAQKETITILRNSLYNIDGRISDGKGGYKPGRDIKNFAFFNAVHSISGAEIAWNQVVNMPFESLVEDNLNIYMSSGASTSPILIHDNYIQGAYPYDPLNETFYSGGGILLGDGIASDPSYMGYASVYDNQVISTTNYGLSILGGRGHKIYNNVTMSSGRLPDGRRIPSTNGGMIVWDYSDTRKIHPGFFEGAEMKNNMSGWTKVAADGTTSNNPWWFPHCTGQGFDTQTVNTCTGNQSIGTVTIDMEKQEFDKWISKTKAKNVRIGSSLVK